MAGTKKGGAKAALTLKKRYGKEFYKAIGAKGGENGTTGGFASKLKDERGLSGRERAVIAGRKGGKISRRT